MVWPGPPPQGSSKPGTQPTFSIRLNGGGKRHWLFGGGSGEGMTEWSLKKPPLVFLTFPPVTAMLSICCPIPCHIWFRQSPPPSIWMQSQRLTPSILDANLIRQHHSFSLVGSLYQACSRGAKWLKHRFLDFPVPFLLGSTHSSNILQLNPFSDEYHKIWYRIE